MDNHGQNQIREQLHRAGFRATPARVALLALLAAEAKPLDVPAILGKLSVEADQATVYRALHSLVAVGLVRQLSLQRGIAHYESAALPHHHHLTCERCGLVEDVAARCQDLILSASSFRRVTRHSLEYSGICEACAK